MAIWLRHNLEANETLAISHAVYWQRQSLTAAIGFDEPTPMAGLGLGWVSVAANGAQPDAADEKRRRRRLHELRRLRAGSWRRGVRCDQPHEFRDIRGTCRRSQRTDRHVGDALKVETAPGRAVDRGRPTCATLRASGRNGAHKVECPPRRP